jgi:protein-S-isoprenylcysteine O-methyltransferase Ste14
MTPHVQIPSERAPAAFPWPPALVVLILALGWLLGRVAPLVLPEAFVFVGALLAALAITGDIWSATTLWRRRTTVLPHRAAEQLVTDGPFRYSRNPIYICHIALTAAIGLMLQSVWIVALTPVLAFALIKFAVEPEEKHLAVKFGEAFSVYAARVGRWF